MGNLIVCLGITSLTVNSFLSQGEGAGGEVIDNIFKRALKRSRESWFGRAVQLFDRAAIDESVWGELEELLISADVGVATTEKIISRARERAKQEKITEGSRVRSILQEEMANILRIPVADVPNPAPPRVTLVVGVNGSGKTTSIAKLAYRLKSGGRSVLIAGADTFRAAAIEQLEHWGKRLGVEVISHQPGADPGAVVYDALQAARSRQVDEVIIDTAGRLHTRYNLMEELKKIRRVAAKSGPTAPHEVILVLDAITGQNGLSQARYFTEAVGVTDIFLAKLDGTAKGGIVLAICDELKIPLRYVGVGEKPEDMELFDPEAFVAALFATD